MKIITHGRRSGKTTKAVIEAAKTGNYIVVANRYHRQGVLEIAEGLGLKVNVLTLQDIKNGEHYGLQLRTGKVIVDEAQVVLEQLLGMEVDMMILSEEEL